MGAGASKPEGASKHVFSSAAPVRFSQELVDSLQASNETNSSRARALELHIAERVAAELSALEKKEDDTLKSLREKISLDNTTSPSSPTSSSSSVPTDTTKQHPQSQDQDQNQTQNQDSEPSSARVFTELSKLRKELEGRKKVREIPGDVATARDDVVSCLRTKDRRPLDCWREVDRFKSAVMRMETDFIYDIL